MQPDPDAITTFLSRLYDTDHNLERELAWSDPGEDAICHGERFAVDDPAGFADRAAKLNLDGCNTYFTPALLEPGGRGRARDEDVAAIPVLWTDLDTPAAVRAPAKQFGVCEPTCSVMTRPPPGTRLHYYFKLAEPMFGVGARTEGKRLNQRIAAHMFGDPTCCNPARLLRVPGTVRWQTADKPVGPYIFGVCWFGEGLNTYTPGAIEAAFPITAGAHRDYGVNGSSFTPTEEWVALIADGASKGERNTTATRFIGYLLRADIHEDIAWALTELWNNACQPPMDEDRLLRTFDSIHAAELRRRIAA